MTLPTVQPRAILAVCTRVDRKGDWTLPPHLRVYAVAGDIRLDLRQARFHAGVSEIEVITFAGQVKITVPHGVRVECDDFTVRRVSPAVPRADAPCIRIIGNSYLGNVKIRVVDPAK